MKVTDNSTFRLMQTNLNRITTDLQELRNQGATGLKFNKSSDDPGAIRPVLNTRTDIQETKRYLETMGNSGDKMASTDSHLSHVENILVRTKEIAINAVNSSLNQKDLNTLADEVGQLRNELLATSNAVVDGKYIFAGFQENTPPFVENKNYNAADYRPNDVDTWPYHYQGDNNPTRLEITSHEFLEVNLTGNEVFMGISNETATTDYTNLNVPAGSIDLFSVLTRTEEAIRAGNVDDVAGAGGSISAQIEKLEVAANQNRGHRSTLGNRATRVEAAMSQQKDAQIDLEQILSRYQDADIIQTYNDIIQKETAFQSALNITGRVSQISILDYF